MAKCNQLTRLPQFTLRNQLQSPEQHRCETSTSSYISFNSISTRVNHARRRLQRSAGGLRRKEVDQTRPQFDDGGTHTHMIRRYCTRQHGSPIDLDNAFTSVCLFDLFVCVTRRLNGTDCVCFEHKTLLFWARWHSITLERYAFGLEKKMEM